VDGVVEEAATTGFWCESATIVVVCSGSAAAAGVFVGGAIRTEVTVSLIVARCIGERLARREEEGVCDGKGVVAALE
jgi:hypothetical protein